MKVALSSNSATNSFERRCRYKTDTTLLKSAKNRFLAMGGGFFHRNEKFQKTKVIYFMLGTSSLMGGSKIQILHFIIIPYYNINIIKATME